MKKECKAVVYTRVATRQLTDGSNALVSQQRQCEEYAEQHGMEITGYFGGFYPSSGNESKQELEKTLTHLTQQHPESPNVMPFAGEQGFIVEADKFTQLSVIYDSGIR